MLCRNRPIRTSASNEAVHCIVLRVIVILMLVNYINAKHTSVNCLLRKITTVFYMLTCIVTNTYAFEQ